MNDEKGRENFRFKKICIPEFFVLFFVKIVPLNKTLYNMLIRKIIGKLKKIPSCISVTDKYTVGSKIIQALAIILVIFL